ncbi:MAG TPA: hypothetical protein VIG24_07525 [Acidimicrobiia bacterium]
MMRDPMPTMDTDIDEFMDEGHDHLTESGAYCHHLDMPYDQLHYGCGECIREEAEDIRTERAIDAYEDRGWY